MLNPAGKTPEPEWARPYLAQWTGEQWIVVSRSERECSMVLYELRRGEFVPGKGLDMAQMPDGSNDWYVGVAD